MSITDYISSLANGQILAPMGSNLVIAEWTAPGTAEGSIPEHIAPIHKHNNDDESWYVVEGTLGFQIENEQIEANAGHAVIVPGGKSHTYWNPKPEQAKYLIIMTKKISLLIDEIHNTTSRDLSTMQELFRKYDSELL